MKQIDLTSEVTININDFGKEILKNYICEFEKSLKANGISEDERKKLLDLKFYSKLDDNGNLTMSMAEIMYVFGRGMLKTPFASTKIIINDEVLEDSYINKRN